MRYLFLGVAALALASGCSKGKKNVAACQDFVDGLSCGEFDFSSIYSDDFCDAYGETKCDVSEYFTCLADGGSCDEETGVYTAALDCSIPSC